MQWLKSLLFHDFLGVCVFAFLLVPRKSLSDHSQSQVRKWSKVSRSSHCAFLWNHWNQVGVVRFYHSFEICWVNSTSTLCKCVDSEDRHSFDCFQRDGVSNTHRMRSYQINLKLWPLLLCDYFISKVAETSVNPINDSVGIRHHFFNDFPTFLHSFPCLRWKVNPQIFLDYLL